MAKALGEYDLRRTTERFFRTPFVDPRCCPACLKGKEEGHLDYCRKLSLHKRLYKNFVPYFEGLFLSPDAHVKAWQVGWFSPSVLPA